MRIIDRASIDAVVQPKAVIDLMAEALIAQAAGECETPMPMHLDVEPAGGEVHIKASARRNGRYFAVKVASGFPANPDRGLPVGNGLMLLVSADTGQPEALLADDGSLTDLRTAAVTALMSRALGREDSTLGIIGSGIQARLQAILHAHVLPLKEICVWGRNPQRVAEYLQEMEDRLPGVEFSAALSPAEVAARARLLVTVTAARAPLLSMDDLQPGTHVAAVGSDSPGKQELDPDILERCHLLLVDSLAQCLRLGELQHATHLGSRAVEAGAFLVEPRESDPQGVTVCDFTGLGVEDLYIAEHVHEAVVAGGGE